jgi:hypothetical protein
MLLLMWTTRPVSLGVRVLGLKGWKRSLKDRLTKGFRTKVGTSSTYLGQFTLVLSSTLQILNLALVFYSKVFSKSLRLLPRM